jgi:hypothetical protein
MIHFVVPARHDGMIRDYLELWGRDVASRLHVVHAESLVGAPSLPRGTYVLAALDQYSAPMAVFIRSIHAALSSHDRVRFLNHPTRTLQRYALLDELHRRGLNTFRAVRIGDDLGALRYPVFLRSQSQHDGALSPLLRTQAEVEAAIGRALVRGNSTRDLLVVEFSDTADDGGYYRKYCAFVVGGHIMPRTLSYSRAWMLKFSGSEFSVAMAAEERDYVLANPHERALRTIFDLAGVGYGRIDYAMKGDRVETWEINLNPTVGRGLRPSSGRALSPELEAIRTPTKEHFYRCFRAAWEDVDLDIGGTDDIPVAIDPAVAQAASATQNDDPRWLAIVRRVLRPAKPLIAPIATLALPAIGRAAIRRTRS